MKVVLVEFVAQLPTDEVFLEVVLSRFFSYVTLGAKGGPPSLVKWPLPSQRIEKCI